MALNALFFALLDTDPQSAADFLDSITTSEFPTYSGEKRNLIQYFLYFNYDPEKHGATLQKYFDHPLSDSNDKYDYGDVLFEPAKTLNKLTQEVIVFFQEDDNQIPKNIIDSDRTKMSEKEIKGRDGYKFRLEENLSTLCYFILDYYVALQKNQIGENEKQKVLTLALKQKQQIQFPVLKLFFTFIAALSGDENNLKELWQYHESPEQQEQTRTQGHVLELDSKRLTTLSFINSLIEHHLISLDPERFFMGTEIPINLIDPKEITYAMAENTVPDTSVPGVGNVIYGLDANPREDTGDHATFVAQVLFGNSGVKKEEPEGNLISYQVDFDAPIYPQLAKVFEDILAKIESGQNVALLNMSFGTTIHFTSQKFLTDYQNDPDFLRCQELLKKLDEKGFVCVIAAGNSGANLTNKISYMGLPLGSSNPLKLMGPNVISIGSYDFTKNRGDRISGADISSFSSRGGALAGPDVLAPGGSWSFWTPIGSFETGVAGTSFSSPFAARVVAQIHAINPNLKGHEIIEIINFCAEDIKNYYPEDQGHGRLVANRAYYIAWLLAENRTRQEREKMATQLNVIHEERELRLMARTWVSRR